MQLGLVIVIALAGHFLSESTSSAHDCDQSVKLHPKPREIRGFKPEYISTAYGFGKREIFKENSYDRIILLLQNLPQSMVLHWLIREIKHNPIFAKKILRKLLINEEGTKMPTG